MTLSIAVTPRNTLRNRMTAPFRVDIFDSSLSSPLEMREAWPLAAPSFFAVEALSSERPRCGRLEPGLTRRARVPTPRGSSAHSGSNSQRSGSSTSRPEPGTRVRWRIVRVIAIEREHGDEPEAMIETVPVEGVMPVETGMPIEAVMPVEASMGNGHARVTTAEARTACAARFARQTDYQY